MFYWKAYVVTFLTAWAILAFEFHYFAEIIDHWRMSVVMILGSLVAGSTPMGGGTVAFPILVLLFHSAPVKCPQLWPHDSGGRHDVGIDIFGRAQGPSSVQSACWKYRRGYGGWLPDWQFPDPAPRAGRHW